MTPGGRKTNRYAAAAVATMLILYAVLAVDIARNKSNTWDEPAHLLAGYAHLTGGMSYLSPLHHPAAGRMVSAVFPAALLDLELDETVMPEGVDGSDFFPYSLKFMYENTEDGRTVLLYSRLGNIVLGVFLGLFVFFWARDLWGGAGAFLSLFIYVLSPNVLAHSSLATTDFPITVFFFITAWCLFRLARDGVSTAFVLGAGVSLALAMASKHTAVLLFPVLAASFVLSLRKGPLKRCAAGYAAILVTAWAVLWAVYGFSFASPSPHYVQPDWASFSPSPVMSVVDQLRGFRVLPESYLYSVAGVFEGARSGRMAYLMGEYSTTGWWYYFIVAFLVKTPLATVILAAAAVLYLFVRERAKAPAALFVILPALLIFTVVSTQKVNIGLRHVLPAYPFIFVLVGFVPSIRTESRRLASAVFVGLCAWYLWAGASIPPHQLAYFNELAGGPANGHRYLVDSNLDWGQDLPGLRDYMDRNGVDRVKLAYFGFTDPAYYGIDYRYLPGYFVPDPADPLQRIEPEGTYAISATLLQGMYLADHDLYAPFRGLRPDATIGYSIFIYRF